MDDIQGWFTIKEVALVSRRKQSVSVEFVTASPGEEITVGFTGSIEFDPGGVLLPLDSPGMWLTDTEAAVVAHGRAGRLGRGDVGIASQIAVWQWQCVGCRAATCGGKAIPGIVDRQSERADASCDRLDGGTVGLDAKIGIPQLD